MWQQTALQYASMQFFKWISWNSKWSCRTDSLWTDFSFIKFRNKSKFFSVQTSKLPFKMFVLNLGIIISVCQKIWIKSCIRLDRLPLDRFISNVLDFIINPMHYSGIFWAALHKEMVLREMYYFKLCYWNSMSNQLIVCPFHLLSMQWHCIGSLGWAQIMINYENKTCLSYSKLIPQINCDKIIRWIGLHNFSSCFILTLCVYM